VPEASAQVIVVAPVGTAPASFMGSQERTKTMATAMKSLKYRI